MVTEIEEKIAQQVKLQTGYYITYGGQFENLKEATQRLSIAVPVALFLILLLLYFSFGSVRHAVLIFSAIPMAAIGGIFALLLRGMPFSISAGVGFIALFGVAVLNGIVLITEFNRLKKLGKYTIDEIVFNGTAIRLRPVLMTATVASLGFLPMAISTAAGAEVQKPLATVVIGGLLTSTILTLIVLPVLYTYFEGFKNRKTPVVSTGNVPLMVIALLAGLSFLSPVSIYAQAGNKGLRKDVKQNQVDPGSVKESGRTAESLRFKPKPEPLTLQEAIKRALANNEAVKSSGLQINQQQALRASAADFGKTNVQLQYGQINGIKRDNNFTASQDIPYPGLFKNQRNLYDARIKSAELNLAVTQNELIYQVRSAYTQLAYFTALQELYKSQDSVYSNFQKASSLRYQAGETNLLEKTTAETQYQEIRNQISKNQSDVLAYKAELQRLLNTEEPVEIAAAEFSQVLWKADLQDSTTSENPVLALQKQQIVIAEQELHVEKSRSGPDFTIGYFNQSIIGSQNINGQDQFFNGSKRFQGLSVGVALPLFFKPFSSRIKAAKIEKEVAGSQYKLFQTNLQGQYNQAYQDLLKNSRSIDYYKKSAVPNADLILKQAQIAFKNGEIGYVEYQQGLKTHSDIHLNYLQAINQYNQSVYTLQYLTGL